MDKVARKEYERQLERNSVTRKLLRLMREQRKKLPVENSLYEAIRTGDTFFANDVSLVDEHVFEGIRNSVLKAFYFITECSVDGECSLCTLTSIMLLGTPRDAQIESDIALYATSWIQSTGEGNRKLAKKVGQSICDTKEWKEVGDAYERLIGELDDENSFDD